MSMIEWAKREIEIACKKERGYENPAEWDYGCACYESAYRAYESLMKDEHSGASISITKSILNCLIDGKPLTPIEDTPDVWNHVYSENDETKTYQCQRMSSLFKDVHNDGTVKYMDVDRCRCVYMDKTDDIMWSNGLATKIVDELYPITMPYYPSSNKFIVYVTEGLSDPKNGDYDTIGVWYIVTPDKDRFLIERFFAESDEGWREISREEYDERVTQNQKEDSIDGESEQKTNSD